MSLTSISCESSRREYLGTSDSKDATAVQPNVVFAKDGAIEILNSKTTNDYPSSENDTTICKNWNLSVNDIEKLIKRSEAIDGRDWHLLFEHLPCSITGLLKQANKTFDFQINGGAWIAITDSDTTLYYGYFKEDGNTLFISTPMAPEDEECYGS